MKQIVITTDPDTHNWIKRLAQSERRTIGQQALHLLLGQREVQTVNTTKKNGQQ
jgi:hypothetical protein